MVYGLYIALCFVTVTQSHLRRWTLQLRTFSYQIGLKASLGCMFLVDDG